MESGSKTVKQWRTPEDYSKDEAATLRMCNLQTLLTPPLSIDNSHHYQKTNSPFITPGSSKRPHHHYYKPISPFPPSPSSSVASEQQPNKIETCTKVATNKILVNEPRNILTKDSELCLPKSQTSLTETRIGTPTTGTPEIRTLKTQAAKSDKKYVSALPIQVVMKYTHTKSMEYEEIIENLKLQIKELKKIVSLQASEILSLRSSPSSNQEQNTLLDKIDFSQQLETDINDQYKEIQHPLKNNHAKQQQEQEQQEQQEQQQQQQQQQQQHKPANFQQGKTGVFARLWKHASIHTSRTNMKWDKLQEVIKLDTQNGRSRHGKIPLEEYMPVTSKKKTLTKKSSLHFEEFSIEELPQVANIYNILSQMAVATLTEAEGAHKRTQHQHKFYWLSNVHHHPLTTSSSDLCMIQSEPQILPIVFEKYFPQILSYLDHNTLEIVGLVSQQLLIYSHHVHVVAFRAEQLIDRLLTLAKCWTIILGQENSHIQATKVLIENVKQNNFVELTRKKSPPNYVVMDIMLALGALIYPNEIPWKYVQVRRSVLRNRNISNGNGAKIVGATWSDTRKLINKTKNGRVQPLIKQIEHFDPTKMSRRCCKMFRGVIVSGVLKPSNAIKGGHLCEHLAKWMLDVSRHTLTLDKMKILGRSHRIDYQKGVDLIKEAKWHASIRRKLNDGKFRFIFGWT